MDGTQLWAPEKPPRQGLGLMHLSDESGDDPDRDPAELVRTAVEAGVTLLDTAEMYGNEEVVSAYREDVLLCSKFGVYWGPSGRRDDWSVRADPDTVRTAIDGSLRRLQVDTIDLYYLHHRSEETPIEETVGAMADLVAAGKIRAVGLSNVTTEDVRRAHSTHPVQAVQEEWSLGRRRVEPMLPALAELGVTLVAYSPLRHGALAKGAGAPMASTLVELAAVYAVTPSQLALAWVHNRGRRLGQSVIPLPGTTRVSHLASNAAAAHLIITVEDMVRLNELSAGAEAPGAV
jgi:aryl-alcohol dehydrogenase-like predicted oxidoreductase